MGTRGVIRWAIAFIGLLVVFIVPANGISCYQCTSTNSSNPFQCGEFLSSDTDLKAMPCSHVYGAKYCVKHVGRFEVPGIKCYQCSTEEDWKCGDHALVVEAMTLKSCDFIENAQHCVTTVGRFGGGVGTKRMCSLVNYGSTCSYDLNQVGDTLKYRTCIYTCSTDGCNPASTNLPNLITIVALTLGIIYLFRR